MSKRMISLAVLVLTLVTLGVACGDDDGADVRSSGEASGSGSGSSSGSGSGSGSDGADVRSSGDGSGSASGSVSASSAEETPCAPVGEELEADADETVAVDLLDYAFAPAEIEVAEGVVTFETTNAGEENHELAFRPGGGEVPFIEDGVPDEDALAAEGAFELEGYSPGQSCNATYELEVGEYTMFCIVAAEDGETHYEKGMAGTLTVS